MASYDVDSTIHLVEAIRRAQAVDSIALSGSTFPDWRVALSDDGWVLTDGRRIVTFDGPCGARVRLIHDSVAYLLVGDNGFAGMQSAIDAATGGETILVAPGTYGEGRPFLAGEIGCPGLGDDTYGLVVNKSVTMQGVSDSGTPITDCDDVVAAVVALMQTDSGESFVVTAPDVGIRGLGFVPAGQRGRSSVGCRVFGIYRERFGLHASIVECNPARRSGNAIHVHRRTGRDPAQGMVVSGCVMHGSIVIEGPDVVAPMGVTIVGNQIVGDLLSPVWVSCDARSFSAAPAEAVLPFLEDNALHALGHPQLTFSVHYDDSAPMPSLRCLDIDEYLTRILEDHGDTGAAIVDGSVRMPAALVPDSFRDHGKALRIRMYASIQMAVDQARHGDTLYMGAGAYQERFTTSGKRLVLLSAVAAASSPLPGKDAPEEAPSAGSWRGVKCYAVIDVFDTSGRDRASAGGDAKRLPASAEALGEERELAGQSLLTLLDGADSHLQPVRHYGRDGRQRGGYFDIQAALDAAEDGDRIEVAPGTYPGDLRIVKAVALQGVNAGRPGGSLQRGIESLVSGHVVVSMAAADVTIDGFSIQGRVTAELLTNGRPHLLLRCCIVDGRGSMAAISILGGSVTMIANNLIMSGADEAIYAPYGFGELAISGNRIQVSEGATGIALNGGVGLDSACILGNTILGGDYGILIEVDGGLDQPGDAITIAGNSFGELCDGVPTGAPAVAAICADGPVPLELERSLGASIGSNMYNLPASTACAEVTFEARKPRTQRPAVYRSADRSHR